MDTVQSTLGSFLFCWQEANQDEHILRSSGHFEVDESDKTLTMQGKAGCPATALPSLI